MRVDTGLLLAVLTISVTFLGVVLARRGQREQARQQAAANDIADRAERFDEMSRFVDVVQADSTRLRGQLSELQAGHDWAMRAQARRCQETVEHLVDTVATLQTVVQDEVARAAAFGSVGAAHVHLEEHDRYLDMHPEGTE